MPPMPPLTETVVETCPVKEVTATSTEKKLPTIGEIKKAVPPECFEKSLPTSLYYTAQDFVLLGVLYYTVSYFEYFGIVGLLAWYWCMGIVGSSLFCIGHDCGHGSFSNHIWVNDIVGHLTHAPLLAPFWPWQKSHRLHHTYTSNLEKDKGHPWITEDDFNSRNWFVRNFSKNPLSGFFRWMPLYTAAGLPDGSHFWPFSDLFSNTKERIQCVVSGAAVGLCLYIAYQVFDHNLYNMTKYYLVPVLFHGFWLVMITYLQHQYEDVQVFEDGEWNYVKGSLETVDRKYGFGLDSIMHHITDGHVAHHLFFTQLPHYNLMKATKAIRKVLEPYQGAYKQRTSYDHLLEFCRLNLKLEYLTGKGTGVLTFPTSSHQNPKKKQ